eukprot:CAMPEP_0119472450 /NCGR_PEP_ID=MMETSP1344-20130328/4509_1 /TAXON_ID=236787 /ORGANISM="Florenciella parvula, Strain CCMP2471" /LENGTH=31 /DNA_ID= /DNA_START= /DNA_END= /DNA_ORIENTATION=
MSTRSACSLWSPRQSTWATPRVSEGKGAGEA